MVPIRSIFDGNNQLWLAQSTLDGTKSKGLVYNRLVLYRVELSHIETGYLLSKAAGRHYLVFKCLERKPFTGT